MGSKFRDRISKLSDDNLLDLYEVCYLDYRAEALEYAKEEILKRNIEKKVWFYNDWSEEYGPYSRDEIIELVNSGDIKENYNIWYEGLDDWMKLKEIDVFGSQINSMKNIKEVEFPNNNGIRPPRFSLTKRSGTKKAQCLVCKGTGQRNWLYRYWYDLSGLVISYILYIEFWNTLSKGWKYLTLAIGISSAVSILIEKSKNKKGKCKNCEGTGRVTLEKTNGRT